MPPPPLPVIRYAVKSELPPSTVSSSTLDANSDSIHLVGQNCVCRCRSSKPIPGPTVAVLLNGEYTKENHASPAAITFAHPIQASLRLFPECKINTCGVRSFSANCVVLWLLTHRVSVALNEPIFPCDIQCTNTMATGYLPFRVDLDRMHEDPVVFAVSKYQPNLISSLRVQLQAGKNKMRMSLFPAGTMVVMGAPSLAEAEDAVNAWMPIIRKYSSTPVDQLAHRKQQAAEQANYIRQIKQDPNRVAPKVVHPVPMTRRTRVST